MNIVLQAAADVDTPKVLAAVAELSLWFRAHSPDLLDIHSAGTPSLWHLVAADLQIEIL